MVEWVKMRRHSTKSSADVKISISERENADRFNISLSEEVVVKNLKDSDRCSIGFDSVVFKGNGGQGKVYTRMCLLPSDNEDDYKISKAGKGRRSRPIIQMVVSTLKDEHPTLDIYALVGEYKLYKRPEEPFWYINIGGQEEK